MVQTHKEKHSYKIELIGKTPYAGSGPRGIDVYTRLLGEELSKIFKLENITLTKGVPRGNSDLTHFTYFDPFFLTLWRQSPRHIPYVVTVHDLIPLRFKSHFPSGIRGKIKWLLQKKALQNAAAIITDSKASKDDIIKYVDYPESKVSIVPLAAGHIVATRSLMKSVKVEYALPDRFLLYVGDINWNKNIPGLLKAYGDLKDDIHLVLVGKAFINAVGIEESTEIEQAVATSGKSHTIHRIGFVPGHHLSAIYRLATLYIQPSWYEGFGFPLLEAMTQGTPVLSSNQGSLSEVGGDCVHYFDPHDHKEFVKKLSQLLSNDSLRTQYINRALMRVKEYSWNKVAKATSLVYESVLN